VLGYTKNNTKEIMMVLSLQEFPLDHLMNEWKMAADLQTKLTNLGCESPESGCSCLHPL